MYDILNETTSVHMIPSSGMIYLADQSSSLAQLTDHRKEQHPTIGPPLVHSFTLIYITN